MSYIIKKYPDGSSYVQVTDREDTTFKINSYESLWHLNQYVDAFNAEFGFAPNIIIPSLLDAQADRRFNNNESFGLKLICNFLKGMKVNTFHIFHPHNQEVVESLLDNVIANEYREIFDKWAMKTVGNTDFVPFQVHDFSMRGMFGSDAARMSGLAHLTSFCGSDTIPSYLDAQYYYDSGQNDWKKMNIVATSVPASEHSVQCAHFNPEDGTELAYLDHLLDTFDKAPVLSIVCDGYDYWKFITEIVPQRKEKIMARIGKVVFRPDSGNIVDIICGEEPSSDGIYYHISEEDGKQIKSVLPMTPEQKGSIEVLAEIFGTTVNNKGYRELDPHVGLIYGDSVTLQIADEVCSKLEDKGFVSTSWVAGIGSYTYQFNTRDSHGQAIKATYIELEETEFGDILDQGLNKNIVGKNIFKDPKTGDGMKKSAKGLLRVYDNGVEYQLMDEVSWDEEILGELKEIFRDGELSNQITLQQIRKNLRK